jgi:hypothetical protein
MGKKPKSGARGTPGGLVWPEAARVEPDTSAVPAQGASAPNEGADRVERAGAGTGRPRTGTVNLPFVTAQFRAPSLHKPGRGDVAAVARGARSLVPSGKAALYFGALAVTAAVGVIEWPVAAAIGVGAALASRGETSQRVGGQTSRAEEQSPERAAADA